MRLQNLTLVTAGRHVPTALDATSRAAELCEAVGNLLIKGDLKGHNAHAILGEVHTTQCQMQVMHA